MSLIETKQNDSNNLSMASIRLKKLTETRKSESKHMVVRILPRLMGKNDH